MQAEATRVDRRSRSSLSAHVAPSVRELERRLAELHYAVPRDGYFGSEDLEAVYAFQKVRASRGRASSTPSLWGRLVDGAAPGATLRGGDHVEIDKTRQVLFLVRDGQVSLIVATSTGATGNTPLGTWRVYRKVVGFDWVLYYPSYFIARLRDPRLPGRAAVSGVARLRAHPDVDRDRRSTRRSPTARPSTST